MLQTLSVQNYALIDAVQLPLNKGMTAITGETGSGKSILLGAFGLLLGERADAKSIRDEKSKCIVEAIFDLKGYGLKSFFQENDLDYEEHTTIRREIAPGGKSRAFINDTPVQLSTLKILGAALVDIHSQHENSLLASRSFQFSVVDAFAKNEAIVNTYSEVFRKYKALQSELDDAIRNEAQMRQEMDFIGFQLAELEKAGLQEIDQLALEQELDTLNNAENIRAVLNQMNQVMEGEGQGVIPALHAAKVTLGKITNYNSLLGDFASRLESCHIELRELSGEMESFAEGIGIDEQRALVLGEKLSAVYHLQKKHRLNTVGELLALREELQQKAFGFADYDEKIELLTKNLSILKAELSELASRITQSRREAAVAASKEVKKFFSELSLDHAELNIEISEAADYNLHGKDEIAFLFRANKGGQLLPVHKVASGGEISRVMLAIKASISRYKKLPVLILDEIDQGVSGEVGKKIGNILKGMSQEMQLLVITHLPQIAGKADQHLKVFKTVKGESTATYVQAIQGEERINELAEMLSGKTLTKAAIENARELMAG
jgi:DNA repair protein RecN (Recombination protein N)